MGPFPGQDFAPKPLPDFYGKFVERREGGNERNARWSSDPVIKLFSRTLIRKILYAIGQSGRVFS